MYQANNTSTWTNIYGKILIPVSFVVQLYLNEALNCVTINSHILVVSLHNSYPTFFIIIVIIKYNFNNREYFGLFTFVSSTLMLAI